MHIKILFFPWPVCKLLALQDAHKLLTESSEAPVQHTHSWASSQMHPTQISVAVKLLGAGLAVQSGLGRSCYRSCFVKRF